MIQLEDRLYTSTEVAEVLGVSLRSVYRYLEEGKLDAEIKTATGRHRFSKKNILEFLYPENNTSQPQTTAQIPQQQKTKTEEVRRMETPVTPVETTQVPAPQQETVQQSMKEEVVPIKTEDTITETQEEPIDWLAKFREAAKKFKEESEKPEVSENVQPVKEEKIMKEEQPEVKYSEEPAFEQDQYSAFSKFTQRREAPVEERPATRILHYRSSLGGLKDIAQNIDKSSRANGVPYAFTMNAGLSLFKPIKPFSILHVYIRPTDLQSFERSLGLTPAEESTSQLCLLVSSDTKVFTEREEVHGLFVVSKQKLMDDVTKMGDTTLIDEAKSVL
jgi:excisionase family DNA binding protein